MLPHEKSKSASGHGSWRHSNRDCSRRASRRWGARARRYRDRGPRHLGPRYRATPREKRPHRPLVDWHTRGRAGHEASQVTSTINLFIFGLGYSAGAFARAMRGRVDLIGGTVRSEERAASLRAEGIAALVFDGTAPGAKVGPTLADATHLLVSIAPGEEGDPALMHHAGDILAAPKLRWIGYLSTVGVYGNYGGA